jgi:DNA polymerase III subunit beta
MDTFSDQVVVKANQEAQTTKPQTSWSVAAKDLQALLRQVSGVVEVTNTIKILSFYLIEVSAGKMSVFATDAQLQLTSSIAAETHSDTPIRVTVSAKKLNDMSRTLDQQERVVFSTSSTWVFVTSGSAECKLMSLSPNDFPIITMNSKDGVGGDTITVPQSQMIALLQASSFAMASGDVRAYLNGLYLEVKDGLIYVSASDGHRLALSRCVLEGAKDFRMLLPRKAASAWLKLLKMGEAGEHVVLTYTKEFLCVRHQGSELITALQEGPALNYLQLLPQEPGVEVVVGKEQLKRALMRCGVLSEERFTHADMYIQSGSLRIVANNFEQEKIEDILKISYAGESFKVALNVFYLLDALNVFAPEEVTLSFVTASYAVHIHDEGAQCTTDHLIMPLSTNQTS